MKDEEFARELAIKYRKLKVLIKCLGILQDNKLEATSRYINSKQYLEMTVKFRGGLKIQDGLEFQDPLNK